MIGAGGTTGAGALLLLFESTKLLLVVGAVPLADGGLKLRHLHVLRRSHGFDCVVVSVGEERKQVGVLARFQAASQRSAAAAGA